MPDANKRPLIRPSGTFSRKGRREGARQATGRASLFGELVNGGTVTMAVVGEGSEAKLKLMAVPPRPAKPRIAPPKHLNYKVFS